VIAVDVGRGVNFSGPSIANDAGSPTVGVASEPELDAQDTPISARVNPIAASTALLKSAV